MTCNLLLLLSLTKKDGLEHDERKVCEMLIRPKKTILSALHVFSLRNDKYYYATETSSDSRKDQITTPTGIFLHRNIWYDPKRSNLDSERNAEDEKG